MSFLAHWIAPAPMKKMAEPKVRPEGEVARSDDPEDRDVHGGVDVDADVGDDEQHHEKHGQQEHAATWRSARRAALGSVSVTRGLCGMSATGR
jgi:hypothetical protein